MSDPFQRSVDSTFERLGIDGVLDPDGLARAVRLLPTADDDITTMNSLPVQSATARYEIRKADWDGFANGALIEIGAELRRVQTSRVEDPRRLKVVLDTVPV